MINIFQICNILNAKPFYIFRSQTVQQHFFDSFILEIICNVSHLSNGFRIIVGNFPIRSIKYMRQFHNKVTVLIHIQPILIFHHILLEIIVISLIRAISTILRHHNMSHRIHDYSCSIRIMNTRRLHFVKITNAIQSANIQQFICFLFFLLYFLHILIQRKSIRFIRQRRECNSIQIINYWCLFTFKLKRSDIIIAIKSNVYTISFFQIYFPFVLAIKQISI